MPDNGKFTSAIKSLYGTPQTDRRSIQIRWLEDQLRSLTPGFYPGAEYDYWSAMKYGVQRGLDGHMMSRVPQTGLLLKSPRHPTFWKTLKGEADAGYEVYLGSDNRFYSRPKMR